MPCMASLAQKIRAEHRMRELLRREALPQPDVVEYGHTCVRFIFTPQMACVIVDLDDPEDEAGDAHAA